jgi:hypothetical protein
MPAGVIATIKFTTDLRLQAWLRLWAIILAACCGGMVVVVIVSLWVLTGFHGLGVDATTLVALLLGTVGAMALGVALMGLVFYSNDSRVDEGVRDANSPADECAAGAGSSTGGPAAPSSGRSRLAP